MSDSVENKIAAIKAEIERKNKEASGLLQYLSVQQQLAKDEELREEEELKRQGIIVGQHIPSLPSRLDLDPIEVSKFEYASTLLIGRDLVQQNRASFLRRTGNLPISELAEARRDANLLTMAAQDPDVPHYLNQTHTAQLREERISVRFAGTLQTSPKQKRKTMNLNVSVISAADKRKEDKERERNRPISMKEKLQHENVLNSINHKLHYLRNPRNDPKAVAKMLVKTKLQATSASNASVVEDAVDGQHEPSVTTGGGSSSKQTSSNKFSLKAKPLDTNPLFVCEPSMVMFQEYDIGRKYTRFIAFRNVSAVSRTVRVLPPARSSAFTLSPLRYPPNCPNGVIAPGMAVSTTLAFAPLVLGDYHDNIKVETESGSCVVTIIAQREPPNLSIPSAINLGACLVGDAMRCSLQCSNIGGTGRFELLETINEDEDDKSNTASSSLRLSPFTIYPTSFELKKNESVDLIFEFVPTVLGQSKRSFIVRCDNGQLREFFVAATAKAVHVSYTEVNGSPFTPRNPVNSIGHNQEGEVFQDLDFKAVVPGSERSQVISVINDTGLPVEFEWVWLDASLPDKYLHREGQKLIQRRQKEAVNAAIIQSSNTPLHIDLEQSRGSASLLRSIQANLDMESSQHSSAAGSSSASISENSARHENFEVFPARGVLAGEGAAEFKLVYSPLKTHNASLRAVMMIKSIPLVCLPSPDQSQLLQRLETEGHGSYMRWRSWIEELSTSGTVDKYRKPNGSYSTSKGLINMATIASLLSAYCSQTEELSGEIVRVDRWLRSLSHHLYDFRNNDGGAMEEENNDDDNSVALDDETIRRQETIEMYDWDTTGAAAMAVDPLYIPPLTLHYDAPNNSNKGYSSASNDSQDYDDDAANTADPPPAILEFSSDELSLLSSLYMDTDNVLKLLGAAINHAFNSQVQHEAVEYLKDCALNHFAAVEFKVHGSTAACPLSVSPPCLEIGGSLPLGQPWRGSVSLANHSEAPIELYLKTEEVKVKRLFKSSHDDLDDDDNDTMKVEDMDNEEGNNANRDRDTISSGHHMQQQQHDHTNTTSAATERKQVKIEVDQHRFLLLPRSTHTIELTITAEALGRFLLTLPVHSADDPQSITIDDIQVTLVTSSPAIRFDCAEVDLGLLGVGAESITTLTFVNEGSVAAMFMMKPSLFLENMIPAKKGQPSNTNSSQQGQLTNRDTARSQQIPLSARSGISRQSSIKSDDFSVADSQATSTDFKIELKNAEVTIEPSTGIIQAQQSMTVSIKAKAGKQPQRIRGMIETRVFDNSGLVEAHRQFLNLRGEVQAPKVMLYPMQHSLGQVYVGRPVQFAFTLENICNLPTKFKFVRPGGASTLFSFALAPLKGSLGAKEKVTIHGSFTALAPGLIDDVISCKMFGIKLPLGIALKALAKGITLEFLPLQSIESPPPLPLAGPDEAQYPHGDKPPEPRPTEPLLLGDAVNLYERKVGRFAVRNLSAIAASFTLKPRKYQVIEKTKRFAATPTINTSNADSTASLHAAGAAASLSLTSIQPVDRPELFLAPHEDGVNKFQSEAGQAYIKEMVHRREDRRFLQSGLGAAYAIDHMQGIIPPWGVLVVQVHAFNDIPGVYDDELEFLLSEGEVIRKFIMPVEMTVHGCPMVIMGHTLGMTAVNHTHIDLISSKPELLGKQLLQLGQALEFTPGIPLMREVIVRNNGSKKSRIKWTVRGLAGKAYGPIKLQFSLTPGKIKTSLRFWEDIAKESPFTVEPRSAILQPYGVKRFLVSLGRSTPASLERAALTADVNVIEADDSKYLTSVNKDDDSSSVPSITVDEQLPSSSLASSSKPSSAKLRSHFSLQLLVEGEIVVPQLILDKHRFQVTHTDSIASEVQQLKLSAKATSLFGQGQGSSASGDSLCRKLVSMTNPLETAVVVNVSVDGPFLLQEVVDVTAGEIPSSGINNPATTAVTSQQSGKNKESKQKAKAAAVGTNSNSTGSLAVTNMSMMTGKTFHLPPHQSTKFMVSFHPKRHLKETLIASFGASDGTGKPTETKGQLLFSFPTGQTLHWPATVSISTPFLTGSSPRLYFGICHVRKDCQALYLLSNPTDVPGRWTVCHVANGGAWKQSTAIRVKGFEQVPEEDDPSVFILSPDHGLVDGPTVSVAAAMAAPPKDYNNKHPNNNKTAANMLTNKGNGKLSLQDTLNNSSSLALMNSEEQDRIVPERVVESSWATNTLTLRDAVDLKHNLQHQSEADACYPMPISISFKPKKNVRYCSRFRFSCEFANSFDVVLQGEGTFEEHEHKPLNPVPR